MVKRAYSYSNFCLLNNVILSFNVLINSCIPLRNPLNAMI